MAQQSKEVFLRFIFDSKGAILNAKELEEELKKIGLTSGKVKNALGDLNKEQVKMSKVAGTAGATVTEFGRLLSDLPYGIHGVANNLSQLASMFALTVSNAKKLNNGLSVSRNVFNSIKDVIFSPVGLLVGFQGLIALLESYTSKSKKAATATKELSGEMESQLLGIQALTDLFTQWNTLFDEDMLRIGLENQLTILINKSTEFKNAFDKLDETQKNNKDTVLGLMTDYQRLLEIRSDITKLSQQLKEEDKTDAERHDLVGRIQVLMLREIELSKTFRKENKKTRTDQQNLLDGTVDYYQHHIKLLTKERDAVARSGEEIDNYNEKIKEFQDALNFLLIAREQNKVEVVLQMLGIADVVKEDVAERIAEGVPTPEEIVKALKAKMAGEESTALMDKILGLKESAEKTIETSEKIGEGLSILGDFFDASAERDIAREKNKTTKINNELRDRLKNENLSAAERERINKRIATNEFNLDKRLDKIREKQFKQQKAFKIAVALADTASMAAKAYLSQLSVPDPFTALARAKAAAAVATAFGLVQVATIAKQKYVAGQTSVAGLGGGGAPGGGEEGGGAPSFNVVGASELNQVAAAVAAQREEPVRAYVVASDVSTAQEMDRNILSEASIG